MKRLPALTRELILERLVMDCVAGRCYWRDATKYHPRLNGTEAGNPRPSQSGKSYWIVKINGAPYRRSQLILMVASGRWPDETVDHINGDSLDDRAANLRHASITQNSWNHKTRLKKADLPMGVRRAPSGRFQARIAHNGRSMSLGVFNEASAAHAAYLSARVTYFGEFA